VIFFGSKIIHFVTGKSFLLGKLKNEMMAFTQEWVIEPVSEVFIVKVFSIFTKANVFLGFQKHRPAFFGCSSFCMFSWTLGMAHTIQCVQHVRFQVKRIQVLSWPLI
jgi:hypothetical protein